MDQNTLSIYIHELRNQCLHMQASFNLFNQALQAGQSQGVLYGGQMILMPTSEIAALLWPSRARARGRGEALRKVLQLNEKHALNDRRLSEVLERSDEKTEEWINKTKGQQIVFDLVGDPATVGDGSTKVEAVYRCYNPATQIFVYRGVAYNLPALAKAVSDVAGRVNTVYRQLFPEQAQAEDAARQQAEAAQKQAATAQANVTAQPSPAIETPPTPSAPAAKPAAKAKAPAKKPAAKKAAPKKTPATKPAAKPTAKKPVAKKVATAKIAAKKPAAKKPVAKKPAAKPAAKKAAGTKTAGKK